VALAGLLHQRKLVSLGELRWGELSKATVTAVVAGAISFQIAKMPIATGLGRRITDIVQLALVSLTWAAAVAAGLWLLKSELPRDLRRRKKQAAYPAVAHSESNNIMSTGREP